MKNKEIARYSGIVFLIVAILHALRVINSWTITIDAYVLPAWVSVVLVIVAGYLAYANLKHR